LMSSSPVPPFIYSLFHFYFDAPFWWLTHFIFQLPPFLLPFISSLLHLALASLIPVPLFTSSLSIFTLVSQCLGPFSLLHSFTLSMVLPSCASFHAPPFLVAPPCSSNLTPPPCWEPIFAHTNHHNNEIICCGASCLDCLTL
jgi:hypothetical protein